MLFPYASHSLLAFDGVFLSTSPSLSWIAFQYNTSVKMILHGYAWLNVFSRVVLGAHGSTNTRGYCLDLSELDLLECHDLMITSTIVARLLSGELKSGFRRQIIVRQTIQIELLAVIQIEVDSNKPHSGLR